jgi:hypothetical protein
MFKLALLALVALFAFSAAAEAIEVKKRREAPGTPAAVWEVVGGFCAIKNWHPAVAECEEITEGDDVFRILTLQDGGKIKERLTDKGDTSYSYEIVESPLPVKNYKATLKVGEDDEENRVEIMWKSEFDANGASDDEAKQVIVGIFEDGVKGIKKAALDLSDAKEDDGDD